MTLFCTRLRLGYLDNLITVRNISSSKTYIDPIVKVIIPVLKLSISKKKG